MTLLRVFVPFAFGFFLSYLFRVVNAVIAPDLVEELGLTAADLGLRTTDNVDAIAFGPPPDEPEPMPEPIPSLSPAGAAALVALMLGCAAGAARARRRRGRSYWV